MILRGFLIDVFILSKDWLRGPLNNPGSWNLVQPTVKRGVGGI